MIETIPIKNAESVRTDDCTVNPEDGERYWNPVWQIVADAVDGRRFLFKFDYRNEQWANEFAKQVSDAGIIHDLYWQDITTDPNDLPDYALDPTRPEFN